MKGDRKFTIEFKFTAEESKHAKVMFAYVSRIADVVRKEIESVVLEQGSHTLLDQRKESAICAGSDSLERMQEEIQFLVWCGIRQMSFPEELKNGTVKDEDLLRFETWLWVEDIRKELPKGVFDEMAEIATRAKDSPEHNRFERSRTKEMSEKDYRDMEIKRLYAEFCRLSIRDRQAVCLIMKKGR